MEELKLKLNDDELKIINKLQLNNEENITNIEDILSEYLMEKCYDENYNPTKEGLIIENIIDKIGEL